MNLQQLDDLFKNEVLREGFEIDIDLTTGRFLIKK